MGNSRPKISCGIDRIARWAAQREANEPDRHPHQCRSDGGTQIEHCVADFKLQVVVNQNGQHGQHENERANDFGHKIGDGIRNCGRVG